MCSPVLALHRVCKSAPPIMCLILGTTYLIAWGRSFLERLLSQCLILVTTVRNWRKKKLSCATYTATHGHTLSNDQRSKRAFFAVEMNTS